MWLYLPYPAALYISNCPLSLLCSSALLFCQLYFPYLPLESASFFLLPLSFFPSPTTIYHFSLDSLSVSQGVAFICASLMSDNADGASLLKATAKEQQRYSAVNQGIVQEKTLVYWEQRGAVMMSERAIKKKLFCCVCCSPPEWVKAISGLLISKNIVDFQSRFLRGLAPSKESKRRMEQESKCCMKLSWSMWVSPTEDCGRNVWERVNRRWGVWWGSLLFQLCGKECCSDVTVAGGSMPTDDTIPTAPGSASQ